MKLLKKIRIILELIKFKHTVFALPFGLISMLVACNGLPKLTTLCWILIALISARSTAMAFNRLVDKNIDTLNPRTKNWPLPKKMISTKEVWIFVFITAGIFIFSAYMLNKLAFLLSPIALCIIYFYSYTKYFTYFSHLLLGLALGLAPIGAWVAVRGEIAFSPLVLAFSVMLWVAGFDIIYSCQDFEFDKKYGLHSMVVRFGIPSALKISRIMHGLMILLLLYFGYLTNLGFIFIIGVIISAIMLIYEHSLVKPNDLSKINIAFFNINGLVSILLFLMTGLDILL